MRRFRSLLCIAPLMLGACIDLSRPEVATVEGTTFASSLGVNLAASTKTSSGLYYRDITVGTGATAAFGQTVSVYYEGALSNGNIFETLKAPTAPFTFTLGAGTVIDGFDEGVRGMRVGGQRQLIIPPYLGYGDQDFRDIPGNSVIVYTVTLVAVQ